MLKLDIDSPGSRRSSGLGKMPMKEKKSSKHSDSSRGRTHTQISKSQSMGPYDASTFMGKIKTSYIAKDPDSGLLGSKKPFSVTVGRQPG